MKTMNKLFLGLGFCAGLVSCSDFDEVNTNPTAAGEEYVKPQYALNNSIGQAQMNPGTAERIVVYNWASAARICGEMSFLNVGRYSDDYTSAYYYPDLSASIKNATLAITAVENQLEAATTTAHEKEFFPNIKQFARIWRAYLISEFVDNFGPYPIESFLGENPVFNSEKDDYEFILKELKEAAAAINTSVLPVEAEGKCDPFDDQVLSSTVANLLTNLGGIKVTEQRSDLASYVKPANYLGIKYDRHYVANTDNPTKQYWLDGMPENLDPRALKIFCLPDDENAENYIDKYNDRTAKDFVLYTVDENGNPIPNKDNPGEIKIDATRCWNGYPAGSRGGWSPTLAYNQLVTNGYGPGCTLPMLGKDYCQGKSRIFFAAWETYFLLAEASLYGWNTGTTAKEAYENGIKASFEYFGVSEYVNDYLNSTNYNRVGTSVKFDHTTEPTAEQMTYVDGYSKEQKTVTYEYPTASKTLYGKALNDHLTKIITQKFIAQTPYLVLEMWSDFRRLGLPFFEIPANESSMTGSDMVNAWNPNSWKDGQKWEFYPQRMRYPSSLENADPEGYKQAVELLGGSDNIITPLWWTGR